MKPDIPENEVFTFESPRKGGRARGRVAADGSFVVEKGSFVCRSTNKSMKRQYQVLRRALLESGSIMADEAGELFFACDYRFDNPSEAANVIQGGSRNGYDCWKDAVGHSLKDRGWYR